MLPTTLWGFVIIAGPILLIAAMVYAMYRNKTQANQVPKDVTERATRELHERINREDQQGGS